MIPWTVPNALISCWIIWVNSVVRGIQQVFSVSKSLEDSLYCITDQTRPSAAIGLQGTLRDDVQRRGHSLFLYNGNWRPLGFIKGYTLRRPMFQKWSGDLIQAKVDYLFVDKWHQRSGIGGALLRAYENYCREHGVGAIILQRVPTIQALRFYSRHGYVNIAGNYMMGKILNSNTR